MKKLHRWFVLGLYLLLILIFAFVGFLHNKENFFSSSLSQYLSPIGLLLITYWVVQNKNDDSKKKERVVRLLEQILEIVIDQTFTEFNQKDKPEDVQRIITMNIRRVENCIHALIQYDIKNKDFVEGIKYIGSEIGGYKNFVTQHEIDVSYLIKSHIELERYANNLSSKCDYLIAFVVSKL